MQEYSVDAGSGSALVERLEALNSILGGIRSSMMVNDEKTEELSARFSRWEEILGTAKGHEVQIEVLREQVAELFLALEKREQVQPQDSLSAETFAKVESLSQVMSELRQVIGGELFDARQELVDLKTQFEAWSQSQQEQAAKADEESAHLFNVSLKPEEILPQLDELRSHQEAIESRLNGISQSVTIQQWEQLDGRQGDLHVRIQQLEATREKLQLRLEQLLSLRENFESRLNDQGLGLGNLEVSLREAMDESKNQGQTLLALREKSESLEGEWRHRVEQLEHYRAEALDVDGRLDVRCQEIAESTDHLRGVLDGLAQREVVGRARDAELHRVSEDLKAAVVALQNEMGEHQEVAEQMHAQLELLRTNIQDNVLAQVTENVESIQQMRLGQARLEEELKQENEKRAEGMSRELVLARDHMDDQQRRVEEDLDQLKKSQREMGSLKEQLEEKGKENVEARREIRVLREQLDELGGSFSRQQRFNLVGLAAVFFLGLGVTTMMLPSASPMLAPAAPLVTQASAKPVLIPLDAPEVSAFGDESLQASAAPVKEVAPVEESTDTEESAMSISPAFSRQESKPSQVVSEASSKVTYTVKDGDSLWKIAKKHPGSGSLSDRIERIKKENQLNDVNIRRGQVLSISL
jgi:chromosome segregation ATPase